jgi:hypothetical protein
MYGWNDSNWGNGAQGPNEWFAHGEIDEEERTARRAGLRHTQ